MKDLLILFIAALTLSACEKDSNDELISEDPTVISTKFFCAMAGANSSQAVTIEVDIPVKGSIKKLSMFTKVGKEVYSIDSVESGKYTLYNHISDCDGRFDAGSYFFVFTKSDDTKVITGAYPK